MSEKKMVHSEEDVLEIIELAVNDIETLARAFNVIDEVCQEIQHARPSLEESFVKELVN